MKSNDLTGRCLRKVAQVQSELCNPRQMFTVGEMNHCAGPQSYCSIVNIIFDLFSTFLQCLLPVSTVNPCCYFPCQHWGVCVRYSEDRYECDCTRTGYHGENCTVRESSYGHETSFWEGDLKYPDIPFCMRRKDSDPWLSFCCCKDRK